jgi:hypothetical protein
VPLLYASAAVFIYQSSSTWYPLASSSAVFLTAGRGRSSLLAILPLGVCPPGTQCALPEWIAPVGKTAMAFVDPEEDQPLPPLQTDDPLLCVVVRTRSQDIERYALL